MGTFRYRHLLNLVALACACMGAHAANAGVIKFIEGTAGPVTIQTDLKNLTGHGLVEGWTGQMVVPSPNASVGPLQGGGIAYGLKRHIFFLRKEKV
jgi:hypothetical protein